MPTLHDTAFRLGIVKRLQALEPRSEQRWGKMSVDQMLWHVNQALAAALGHIETPQEKLPLPAPLIKFFTLNMPWPKGAPTARTFVASAESRFQRRTRPLPAVDRRACRDECR